jgi:hypothetical protein
MELKKIAVIMSLYKSDSPVFYKEALNSIKDQNYGRESIRLYQVIDGEISKELEAVVNEFSDVFYKLIRVPKNQGLANALNQLVSQLDDEEYIFRMDSDDIARRYRIEKQVEYMEKTPEIGVSGTAISEFYENGKNVIRCYPGDHKQIETKIHLASPFAHPTVCFRKDALKLLGSYSTKYYLCEDIEMWFRGLDLGLIYGNIPEVCLDFRLQSSFFKRRSFSKAWSEYKVYTLGVFRRQGCTIKLIVPIARLLSRLLPKFAMKILYKNSLRNKLLK